MIRKYIIVADDSIKGFNEEIARLEREWGTEEISPLRQKGKWISDKCSICGYGVNPWNNTPYCPNCGADMTESE